MSRSRLLGQQWHPRHRICSRLPVGVGDATRCQLAAAPRYPGRTASWVIHRGHVCLSHRSLLSPLARHGCRACAAAGSGAEQGRVQDQGQAGHLLWCARSQQPYRYLPSASRGLPHARVLQARSHGGLPLTARRMHTELGSMPVGGCCQFQQDAPPGTPLCSQQRGVDACHPRLRRHQRHHRCVSRCHACQLRRPPLAGCSFPPPQRRMHRLVAWTAPGVACRRGQRRGPQRVLHAFISFHCTARFELSPINARRPTPPPTPTPTPRPAVPIYDSLGESAVEYIVNHSGGDPRLLLQWLLFLYLVRFRCHCSPKST